jgi:hypothetical protein
VLVGVEMVGLVGEEVSDVVGVPPVSVPAFFEMRPTATRMPVTAATTATTLPTLSNSEPMVVAHALTALCSPRAFGSLLSRGSSSGCRLRAGGSPTVTG